MLNTSVLGQILRVFCCCFFFQARCCVLCPTFIFLATVQPPFSLFSYTSSSTPVESSYNHHFGYSAVRIRFSACLHATGIWVLSVVLSEGGHWIFDVHTGPNVHYAHRGKTGTNDSTSVDSEKKKKKGPAP